MQVLRAHPTAAEANSDTARPHLHYVHKPADVPAAATAVPPPSPDHAAAAAAALAVHPPAISEQALYPMCFAYALLTPPSRNPWSDIRGAIHSATPRLPSLALFCSATAHGTMGLRFYTPADLETAMSQQPFEHAGRTVTLVRAWETAILEDYLLHNVPGLLIRSFDDLLVHVALRRYPAEQRTEREIGTNCRGFGWVIEVDRACFDAPDLATINIVLCVGHPREIPRELCIVYADRSISVVPVEILGVWDWPTAFRAHRRYVRFFQQPHGAAAPAALLGSRLQPINLS